MSAADILYSRGEKTTQYLGFEGDSFVFYFVCPCGGIGEIKVPKGTVTFGCPEDCGHTYMVILNKVPTLRTRVFG